MESDALTDVSFCDAFRKATFNEKRLAAGPDDWASATEEINQQQIPHHHPATAAGWVRDDTKRQKTQNFARNGEALRYKSTLWIVDAEEPGEKQAIFYTHDDVVADAEMLEILPRDGEALDGVAVAP